MNTNQPELSVWTLLSLNRVLDWLLCSQELTSRSSFFTVLSSTSTSFPLAYFQEGWHSLTLSSSFRAVSSITHVVVSPDASGCVWVSFIIPSFFPSDTRKMKNKSCLSALVHLLIFWYTHPKFCVVEQKVCVCVCVCGSWVMKPIQTITFGNTIIISIKIMWMENRKLILIIPCLSNQMYFSSSAQQQFTKSRNPT